MPDDWKNTKVMRGRNGPSGRDRPIEVAYASIDCPLGTLVVAATRQGLVRIGYDYEEVEDVLEELAQGIPARLLEAPGRVDTHRRDLDEYFEGRRSSFDSPIDWRLTSSGFNRRVLQATSRIPYGTVSTYRDVAREAGSPRAARAAGNALASNPIPIVVPCHRVVHSGGGIGGYTSRLDRKEFLLKLEGALL